MRAREGVEKVEVVIGDWRFTISQVAIEISIVVSFVVSS